MVRAISLLDEAVIKERFMQQEYESASRYYRPNLEDAEEPYKDIRDFQKQV